MTGTVVPFPRIAPCPHCLERFRSVALDRHIRYDCDVLRAKRAHPSNHRPDNGGVA